MFIGSNIQRWREFKGIKQDGLAGRLGITKNALSNIETGKTDVNVSRLEEIAQLLQVEPLLLFSSPQQVFQFSHNHNINSGYTQNFTQIDQSIIESYNAQLQAKDRQIEQLMSLLNKQ